MDFGGQPHESACGQALVEDVNQLVVAGFVVDGLRGQNEVEGLAGEEVAQPRPGTGYELEEGFVFRLSRFF